MRQIRNNKIEDDEYEGGKLLKQTVFPDENGKIRKLVKRKRLILTYDPIGSDLQKLLSLAYLFGGLIPDVVFVA